MVSHVASVRVRYADTDKMQFVYNGKYLEYFEVGRTELLRSVGMPYTNVEKEGYQLPLIEAGLKYKQPAHYDDMLNIKASLNKLFSAKVHIEYEIRREEDDSLIVTGFTTHMFINSETKRPTKPPQIYVDALKKYFEK
jgi:acyl-CoA thioester hydrolase